MNSLDPDDPRPPYQQVANALRAAILTRGLTPGEKLPSQSELAIRYGVARMTIQQALRLLREEHLIVSRQGSGVYVRERTARPVGLRPHLEAAFEADDVTIDFAGFTAETLHNAMQEPLDKIRTGRLTPTSIRVRLLLVDITQPLAIPIRADGADSGPVRARMGRTINRYAGGVTDSVHELADLGVVEHGSVEVRVYGSAPMLKMYLVNGEDLFLGFYPVVQHEVTISGQPVAINDPMGKDTTLFHQASNGDPESTGGQYISEAARWFNSVWAIARPLDDD